MELRISRDETGSISVKLPDSVNLETVPELRKRLLSMVRREPAPSLRLDFSRVSGFDTSGVAMLVELRNAISNGGGKLLLTGLAEETKRVIDLANLNQLFAFND